MEEKQAILLLPTEPRESVNAAFFTRKLYGIVLSFVHAALRGSFSESEDVAQEALLEAWRGRKSFHGDSDPVTWVLAIAKNRIRARFRRAQRGAPATPLDISTPEPPSEAVESLETGERLHSILDTLDREDRELLLRRHVEGTDVRTLAGDLGLTQDAVKSRLYRARRNLRERLISKDGEL